MLPFISDDKIEEIRDRCSILTVISGYLSLKKAGRNYVGLCPFHAEKTPSFTVNEEKGIFHCFGCGAGGNVFSFLTKLEGKPFPEVVRDLAEKEGIDIPDSSGEAWQSESEKKADSEKKGLYAVHEEGASLYHKLLMRSEDGASTRSYLKERGLDSNTANVWQLGFGGKGWSTFSKALKSADLKEKAEKAGLIINGKRGGFYDRFRERLVFPIFDIKGRTVGFGGRVLEEGGPKYMNSPESPIYSKGHLLYGLNNSKDAIREMKEAILVEGYMDLLSLYQYGIKNVVATLGTALTTYQASLLGKYCKRVVLFFDSDEAGLRAAKRGVDILLGARLSPFVLVLPDGEDPDSFVRGKGGHELNDKILGATPAIEFLLEEKLKERKTSSPADNAAVINEIIPYLRKIGDELERSLTVKKIAERMLVDERLVVNAIQSPKKVFKSREAKRHTEKVDDVGRSPAEEAILDLMMNDEAILERVITSGLLKYFIVDELRHLGQLIEGVYLKAGDVSPSALMRVADGKEMHGVISVIAMKGVSFDGFSSEEIFNDCEKKVINSWQLEEEKKVNRLLEEARKCGDDTEVASLLEKKQQLFIARKKGTMQKESINEQ